MWTPLPPLKAGSEWPWGFPQVSYILLTPEATVWENTGVILVNMSLKDPFLWLGKSSNNASRSGWRERLLLTKNPVCSLSCRLPETRYLVWTVPATLAALTEPSPTSIEECCNPHLSNKLMASMSTSAGRSNQTLRHLSTCAAPSRAPVVTSVFCWQENTVLIL